MVSSCRHDDHDTQHDNLSISSAKDIITPKGILKKKLYYALESTHSLSRIEFPEDCFKYSKKV